MGRGAPEQPGPPPAQRPRVRPRRGRRWPGRARRVGGAPRLPFIPTNCTTFVANGLVSDSWSTFDVSRPLEPALLNTVGLLRTAGTVPGHAFVLPNCQVLGTETGGPLFGSRVPTSDTRSFPGMMVKLDVGALVRAGTSTRRSIDSPDEVWRGRDEPDCPRIAAVHLASDVTPGGLTSPSIIPGVGGGSPTPTTSSAGPGSRATFVSACSWSALVASPSTPGSPPQSTDRWPAAASSASTTSTGRATAGRGPARPSPHHALFRNNTP